MSKFVVLAEDAEILVWWPCTIAVPVNSDSETPKTEEQTVRMLFRIVGEDKLAEFKKGLPSDMLIAVARDWDAIDTAGKPVPFARFPAIARVPYVRDALVLGYYRCVLGHAEKN